MCLKLNEFADISIIATQPSLHFLNISKECSHLIAIITRYNPQIYEEFQALHIPIYTDHDEWDDYKSVKKDPVLHVEVFDLSILFCSYVSEMTSLLLFLLLQTH